MKKFRVWIPNEDRYLPQNEIVEFTSNAYGELVSVHSIYKDIYFIGTSGKEYCILEQYINRNDSNNEELYENDIVEWYKIPLKYALKNDPNNTRYRDVITMDRFPKFWLRNEEFGNEGDELVDIQYCIKIGNINQHPELLKGECYGR